MVECWPNIDNFILIVKHKNLITLTWVIYKAETVVNEPHITNETVKFQKRITLTKSIQDNLVEITHGSIANETADHARELLHEVGRSYSANWSSIDTDFPFDSQSIHKKLKHPFNVNLLLIGSQIRWKYALLGLSITTIVPNQYVAVSSEEEVEPVGIRGRNHPLVNQSIRIAHYYRWFI